MDGFFSFFEKLSQNSRFKLLIIIIGLLMPSLLYFVIRFPNEFFELDLIKVMTACVAVNFTTIFITTFIILLAKIFIYLYRRKFIKQYRFNLNQQNKKNKDNLIKLRNKINEDNLIRLRNETNEELATVDVNEIEEESNSLSNDLEEVDMQYNLLTNYVNEFNNIDIGFHISMASMYYITGLIFMALVDFFSVNDRLPWDATIITIKFYLISVMVVLPIMNILEDIPKVKKMKEFNKQISETGVEID